MTRRTKTRTKTPRTKKAVDPRTLAAQLVARHFQNVEDERLDHLLDADAYVWADERLTQAIRTEVPNHATYYKHLDDATALEKTLRAALGTEALKSALFAWGESFEQRGSLERTAAFLMGIEVGKRLAGGAR